jgi:cyclophilin family peptidyl-prolyl cis-trans isomerase
VNAHPNVLPPCAVLACAVLVVACGGGGGDAQLVAAVTSSSAGPARYSQSLLITLQGTHLDRGIALTSPGCSGFTLSTAAPNISTASTAYYRCTVTAVGAQQVGVVRSSDGVQLAGVPFSVAVPQVTMAVSQGTVALGSLVITLAPQQVPLTVNNFLAYVNAGFYNGTVFHRVGRTSNLVPWVIQGGGYAGPLSTMGSIPSPKATNPPVPLEVGRGLSNLSLTVAMARTGLANSAAAEFYFNVIDNAFLDTLGGGYAVFGSISAGAAVLNAMTGSRCSFWPDFFGLNSDDCLPEPNLTITSATQTS